MDRRELTGQLEAESADGQQATEWQYCQREYRQQQNTDGTALGWCAVRRAQASAGTTATASSIQKELPASKDLDIRSSFSKEEKTAAAATEKAEAAAAAKVEELTVAIATEKNKTETTTAEEVEEPEDRFDRLRDDLESADQAMR